MTPDSLQMIISALRGNTQQPNVMPIGDVVPIRPGAGARVPFYQMTEPNQKAYQGHLMNHSVLEGGQPLVVPGNLVPFPTIK